MLPASEKNARNMFFCYTNSSISKIEDIFSRVCNTDSEDELHGSIQHLWYKFWQLPYTSIPTFPRNSHTFLINVIDIVSYTLLTINQIKKLIHNSYIISSTYTNKHYIVSNLFKFFYMWIWLFLHNIFPMLATYNVLMKVSLPLWECIITNETTLFTDCIT